MIKPGRVIQTAGQIAEKTSSILFDDEELILTEVSYKSYGHKIKVINNVWHIEYLEDYEYFKEYVTRKVLIEKTKKFSYLYWYYHFYEPIEIIGKGSELEQYKKLFSVIRKDYGGVFAPETTLVLKRK